MISPPEQSPNDKATTSKKKRIVDKSEVWKHFVKTNIDGIDYDICNVHNEDENKVCGKKSSGIFYAMKVLSKDKIISNNLVKYA